MATAPAEKLKKREKEPDFKDFINKLLNDVEMSKSGFTPKVVQQYEVAGQKSLDEKEKQQRLERVPSRPLGKMVVSKNEATKKDISPLMTENAIEKAISLGDVIDAAAERNKKPNFDRWVRS